MAMQSVKKQQTKVTPMKPEKVEQRIKEAIDKTAEDQTPFLKQETNGDVTVMGDPTLIDTENHHEYTVTFVLPKDEFDPEDFDNVGVNNSAMFTTKTTATQEKITPYNRTYLATVAIDFFLMFFNIDEEGNANLMDDMQKQTLKFFRDEMIIENTKVFVGKLLGIPEDLVPYMNDMELVDNAVHLIIANPSLMNEAYFTVKY